MVLALGIEVAGWSESQQFMQRTADMAALAGAEAYQSGATAQSSATAAAYVAEINGAAGAATRSWSAPTLSDGTISVTVNTNSPANVVSTITKTVPFRFAGIALSGSGQTLTASSTVALVPGPNGKYCVLALDHSSTDVAIDNGATITATACGIYVDATDNAGLTVTGATLNVNNLGIGGTSYTTSNGGVVTYTNLKTSAAALTNPYAGVAVPTPGSCNMVNHQQVNAYNDTETISNPGTITYCNGLSIGTTATANITMTAGIYIIDGGNFFVGAGSTLTATAGVTIVLTADTNHTYGAAGTVQIGNGATVSITAPTSGATAGLAIFQNPNAPSTGIDSVQGGANMIINGAMVFASQTVQFSNGVTNTGTCTQLIAYQIVFVGGADFNNNCSGTGTTPIAPPTTVTLTQ